MNCPKCGKEMDPGFLQAGNLMAFNKRRHKLSLGPKYPGDTLIVSKAFTATDFNGFICRDCGFVLFDYRNPITHW